MTANPFTHMAGSLGARWGVSQGHISNVKSQKTYRDFSSPWFGLGARG